MSRPDAENHLPDQAVDGQVDPFIAFVPDPYLGGFYLLPLEEQRWRARIYAAVYLWSGSAPYSWAVAMDRDPTQVAAMLAFLGETDEASILAGMQALIEQDPRLSAPA